jgi:hypothetical protein
MESMNGSTFFDPEDLDQQIYALASDGWGKEAKEAIRELGRLLNELPVQDQGRLGQVNSRNHTRLVSHQHSNESLVLKLTIVEIGQEVPALLTWQNAKLDETLTAHIHQWGVTPNGWTWSLQQLLPGTNSQPQEGGDIAHQIPEIAKLLLQPAQSFPDVRYHIEQRLKDAGPERRTASVCQKLLTELPEPTYLVHGDLGAHNLLRHEKMIRVIDPMGLKGYPESDLAKFLALSTAQTALCERLVSLTEEHDLNLSTLSTLVACELVAHLSYSKGPHLAGRVREEVWEDADACVRLTR